MVADLSVYFDFGGTDGTPGTSQDTDVLGPPNIRFKRADNATIDALDPIPIPTTGTNYSRWKQLYLYCDVAPSQQVDNIRTYTDGGGFGTGVTVKIGLQFPTKNSGSSAGYYVSDTDDEEMVAGHGGLTSSGDIFGYTEAAPLAGPSISETGNVIDAVGETSNYIVVQMEVISTASPGNLADETWTFKYDEI